MARCTRKDCRRWRPGLALRWFRLGRRLDGDWFCSDACVETEAGRRLRAVSVRETTTGRSPLPLGSVLLRQRGITAHQLNEALAAQRPSGLRLGEQLVRLGYLSREALLRALSAQYGVPYLAVVDPAAVQTGPGKLSVDEVRALGVVPFRESAGTLLVACRAPLPRAALEALTELTGRIVEPYLVVDEDLLRLQEAYGGLAPETVSTLTVRDIGDGAARIAAATAGARDVTVKEARVDPFTWVRIAADGHISTLLVPPFSQQMEEHDAWLAATTRH
jgi:hypothetical protein